MKEKGGNYDKKQESLIKEGGKIKSNEIKKIYKKKWNREKIKRKTFRRIVHENCIETELFNFYKLK